MFQLLRYFYERTEWRCFQNSETYKAVTNEVESSLVLAEPKRTTSTRVLAAAEIADSH